MMNCENIKQTLPLYLNDELDHGQFIAVKNHLESCTGCLSELKELQELESLLQKNLKTETAPDLQPDRIKSKKRYYYLSYMAAAVLVFLIVFLSIQPEEANLNWENHQISELIEMNDNLDILDSDKSKLNQTLPYNQSADSELLYTIGEDIDYLNESKK
jgi:predicted anti-sigma-YlaC factor YlaD